jgi:small subunit ribosomal protein S6
MRQYETLCVLHPELTETRIEELITWMQGIVEGMKGQVRQVDKWGARDLSHRIRKQRRGYYIRLEHEAEPQGLSELERNLKLSENVLRFMSVKIEAGQRRAGVQAVPTVEEKRAESEAELQPSPAPQESEVGQRETEVQAVPAAVPAMEEKRAESEAELQPSPAPQESEV